MSSSEYNFDSLNFEISDDMIVDFQKFGYILVRNLLSLEEVNKVKKNVDGNEQIEDKSYKTLDADGRVTKRTIWNHPGNDVTGMVARSEKVAKTCEKLLGGEVYHYHSKIMMKNPRIGGAHVWHQDYGYWYKNGCLQPDMMSVFIALDACTRENGCLQVLKGSHLCGRVNHDFVGGQQGADIERVNQIRTRCGLVHVTMDPGDALFFHANVLHQSDANLSEHRRWVLICCYNRADNDPVYDHHHPRYTPLEIVPNSAIISCKDDIGMDGKSFSDTSLNNTVKAL